MPTLPTVRYYVDDLPVGENDISMGLDSGMTVDDSIILHHVDTGIPHYQRVG